MWLTSVAANACMPVADSTPPAYKLDSCTKYHILKELRTNLTRAAHNPLNQKQIATNFKRLKAHFAATGGRIEDVLDELHPKVRSWYRHIPSQTAAIVAAIDGRTDVIEAKLDLQQRILTGQTSIEDRRGLSHLDLLAQNRQAMRALQSQNIQLRAELLAEQKAQKEQQKNEATKVRKTALKHTC
jgi:hypothetical protein